VCAKGLNGFGKAGKLLAKPCNLGLLVASASSGGRAAGAAAPIPATKQRVDSKICLLQPRSRPQKAPARQAVKGVQGTASDTRDPGRAGASGRQNNAMDALEDGASPEKEIRQGADRSA
jgi:hypothetical protein